MRGMNIELKESRVESIPLHEVKKDNWLKEIDGEEEWDFETPLNTGKYHVNVEKVPVHFAFYRGKEGCNRIIIALTGAQYGRDRKDGPRYSRGTYVQATDASMICVDDPMIYSYRVSHGFFAGTSSSGRPIWEVIAEVLREALGKVNIPDPDIVFLSSSSGGIGSILTSSCIGRPSTVVAINSQIHLARSPMFRQLNAKGLMDKRLADVDYIPNVIRGHPENTYILMENLASHGDYFGHYRFLCKKLGMKPYYGLHNEGNVITWVYYGTSDKPHMAQDWATFFPAIEFVVDNKGAIDKVSPYLLGMFTDLLEEHHMAARDRLLYNGVDSIVGKAMLYTSGGDFELINHCITNAFDLQKLDPSKIDALVNNIKLFPDKGAFTACLIIDKVGDDDGKLIRIICDQVVSGNRDVISELTKCIKEDRITESQLSYAFTCLIERLDTLKLIKDRFELMLVLSYSLMGKVGCEPLADICVEKSKGTLRRLVLLLKSQSRLYLMKHAMEVHLGKDITYELERRLYSDVRTAVMSDCKTVITILEYKWSTLLFDNATASALLNGILEKSSEEVTSEDKVELFGSIMNHDNYTMVVQQALSLILQEFDRVCQSNNIKYTLACGTMIGAVRHGGFVPWDDDADLYMVREDYEALKKCIKTNKVIELREFTFQRNFSSRLFLRGMSKERLFIDIFTFDYSDAAVDEAWAARNSIAREMMEVLNRINCRMGQVNNAEVREVYGKYVPISVKRLCPSGEKKTVLLGIDNVTRHRHCYSVQDYYPVKRMPFEGMTLSVAKNYEDVLRINYGEYLSFPKDMLTTKHKNDKMDLSKVIMAVRRRRRRLRCGVAIPVCDYSHMS